MKRILFVFLFFGLSSLALHAQRNAPTLPQGTEGRPRVGLVLSGGGAKGMAHVGVLKVLEELNIPIDYIAGTSMGAIIGGLYACGYTAHELDSIICATNWSKLLKDVPDWQDLLYTNKNHYILQLPWNLKDEEHGSAIIPFGLLQGQHISNLLYTLTSTSYRNKNFEELNIPFFCVATNLADGQLAYIDRGNMGLAMRASMSIPGVFSPVKTDSMLLVDGGVLNNFPVDILRNKKVVDLIIGVDVGFSYGNLNRINNFTDVLEEIVFMGSKDLVLNNRELCDVYIKPSLGEFNSASFTGAASIIPRGEQAARDSAVYAKLKALSEKLASFKTEPKEKQPYLPPDDLYISRIEYTGLKKYNRALIHQYLQVETDKIVKLADITRGIDRIYGLGKFKTVSYELKPDESNAYATVLVVHVEEAPSNIFKLGVHYDNVRLTSLLAGLEFQNFSANNSVITIDAEVSKMPVLAADFQFTPQCRHRDNHSFRHLTLGAGVDFFHFETDLYRDPNNRRNPSSNLRLNHYRAKLYTQSAWKSDILGFGAAYEYAYFDGFSKESVFGDVFNNQQFYPYLYFRHDNYDRCFYPSRGFAMNFDAEFPVLLGKANTGGDPASSYFLKLYWKGDFAFSIGKRLSFYPGFTIGMIPYKNRSIVPIQHHFFQGGHADFGSIWNTMMPGVLLGQSSGHHLVNVRLTAQLMLVKNLYLSMRGAVGKADYDLQDFIHEYNNLIYGGNVGLSYNTPIGPVGLSFQTSNVKKFNVFLHIGYWF